VSPVHLLVGFHAQALEKLPNGHYAPTPLAEERRQVVLGCASLEEARLLLDGVLAALSSSLAAGDRVEP
jgi:hypothetical protein